MGDHDDLVRVVRDRAIYRLAVRRAGSHELAEDALQEVSSKLVKMDLGPIDDVRAYFVRALVREIHRMRARPSEIPIEDFTAADEQRAAASRRIPQDSVEHEAEIRRLAQTVLNQLNADNELAATVPGRSADPQQYRAAIITAAWAIFLMLLQGMAASADWNAALKSSYSWFTEADLAPEVIYQRLSRGRLDVRTLLQRLVPQDQIR